MIPDGWIKTRLGKVSVTITSGSRDWAKYYSPKGSKFIRMTNLPRDGIYLKLNDMKYVDVQSNSADGKRTSLKTGDILISITAELGKVGLVPKGFGEAYINQHTALIRLDQKTVTSMYIAYLLSSRTMNHKINRLNDSGAKAGLNLSTIKSIPIAIPPFQEQKKIANILSTWDKAIETIEKLIENSRAQKKTLMQQLLTGKKRFAGFEGEWEIVKIKQLGKIVSGGTPSTTKDEYWNGNIYWVTPTDITKLSNQFISNTNRKITEVGVSNSSANLVPKGSLLVCTRATVGAMAITTYSMTTNQGFKNIIPNKQVDIHYLYYLLTQNKHYLVSMASGSTFLELSKKDFENLSFMIPIKAEQQKIASVLTNADKEIELLGQQLSDLKQEKKALMQQLLTGKRRVTIDTTSEALC